MSFWSSCNHGAEGIINPSLPDLIPLLLIGTIHTMQHHSIGGLTEDLYIYTSYGGGFAALWLYQDRSSPAQHPGIRNTPGFQVLRGYQKLGTHPDRISSPGSHFAVLEHINII